MGTEPDVDGTLLKGPGNDRTRLNMELFARIAERPELFSGRERVFWSDPYVSEHLLNAHLDPETEAASRKPAQIDLTLQYILAAAETSESGASRDRATRVLDLGCGPGLYSQRLAEAGCDVTGIDISPTSIAHARNQAKKHGVNVTYACADFRDLNDVLDPGRQFDLALQVYGEVCTLPDSERTALFGKVHEVLRPGGIFLFDVFTEDYVNRIRTGNDWYVSLKDGFWQPGKHSVLEQTFRYPSDSASVARYTIIDGKGGYRQFSVWWRHFTQSEIAEDVTSAGFVVDELTGEPWGTPLADDGEWITVACRRPEG